MEATQNVVHIDKFQAPNLVGIIAQALEQHIESIVSTKVHAMITDAIKENLPSDSIGEQVEVWMKENFSDSFSDEMNNWMSHNFDISDHFDIRDYADEIGEIAGENISGDAILEALSSNGCTATISF
jgi:hypothetical protein